jgi:signal transduction histidine kinase
LLEGRVDRSIEASLAEETRNLERLVEGTDPETGQTFGTQTRRIFDAYMTYSPPDQHEAFVAFIDGRPVAHSPEDPPYRLDEDETLARRWGTVTQTDRGSVDTPAGQVEYVAVPLREGDDVRGVFVAAAFRDLAAAEMREGLWAAVAVGAVMLLGGAAAVFSTARGAETPTARRGERSAEHETARSLESTFASALPRLEAALERRDLARANDDDDAAAQAQIAVISQLAMTARVSDDLLTLAQAEHPGFLIRQEFDADRLVDEVLAEGAALADRRWHLDSPGGGRIVADRSRLLQALMHFVRNAVQHTDEDDEIGIGSVVELGEIRFWVRDTGRGIPLDDQKRVFQRFYRGQHASAGAGLGLTVADAVARAHGGRVEMISGPGAGTIAGLVLPPQSLA